MDGTPYVILNAAMTIDGKIATIHGDSVISGREDLRRVHRLRSQMDAVMVGINTVLSDDPMLTVRYAKGRSPARVIVDSTARTPLGARVLKRAKSIQTIIAVTNRAPKRRLQALEARGASIIRAGSTRTVDLKLLMRKLRAIGIRKILLEGGGTLNWSMLKERLVDEVKIAIAPMIVGGRNSITLVEGRGFATINHGIRLRLLDIARQSREMVLRYSVLKD